MVGWLFSPLPPHGCEKDHIAPQLCQKKKDTKEKGGGWVFAFHSLAPSGVGHGLSGNTLKVFKVFYI
ncbi:hypothetical protein [Cutibacterium phage PAVL20]|nr:hypothetical protein [Cutibacterium phage FD2]QPB11685.1 hypothetical protein [Cutibacterium phage PAVL20]QPB11896.1 hypothetical protein [Cutibacterium phage PAVL45]